MSRVFIALVVVLLLVCQVWGESVSSSSPELQEKESASFIEADEEALVDLDADAEALTAQEAEFGALLEAAAEADAEADAELELAKRKVKRGGKKRGNKRGTKRAAIKIAPAPAPPGTPTLTQLKLYRQLAKAHEGMYEKILKSYNRPPLDAKFAKDVARAKELYNYYYVNKYNKDMQKHAVNFDVIRRMIATKNPNVDAIDWEIESNDDHLQDVSDVVRVEERHNGKLVKVLTGDDAIIDLAGNPKERLRNLKIALSEALKTGSLKLDEMAAITLNKFVTKNDILAAPEKKKKTKKAKAVVKKAKKAKVPYVNGDLIKPFGGIFKSIKGKFNMKDVQDIYGVMSTNVDDNNAVLDRADNKRVSKISDTKGMEQRYGTAPLYAHMTGPSNTLAKAVGEAPAFFY